MGLAQQRHVIDDDSKVGEARRAAQTLASADFDETVTGRVAIAATELANNLIRHAGGGDLLLQLLRIDGQSVLELLAIDRGPGMADLDRCLADGYSTRGTSGTGLGAVRRLADEFDIFSVPGEGTLVMARFGKARHSHFGAVCVALQGEAECGDAWHLVNDGTRTAAIVIDGLGHGAFAAQAAKAGVSAFAASPWASPQIVLEDVGRALSSTRGGAAACALMQDGKVSYAGIGNISGTLLSETKSQGLVSHAGTLGMQGTRRAQQFDYARAPASLLILHSDGISARWNLRERGDLLARHPALVAAALYRDHARERDDATVLVIA